LLLYVVCDVIAGSAKAPIRLPIYPGAGG